MSHLKGALLAVSGSRIFSILVEMCGFNLFIKLKNKLVIFPYVLSPQFITPPLSSPLKKQFFVCHKQA